MVTPEIIPSVSLRVGVCKICGQPAEYLERSDYDAPYDLDACSPCAAKIRFKAQHERTWKRMCPPLYQDTDRGHQNFDQSKLAKVVAWSAKSGGLLLYGPSGRGKTRAAYLAARRHYDEGWKIMVINAVQFARASADQFNDDRQRDARKILEQCDEIQLLMFDDLGKAKMTERAELDLYSMLETRAAYKRPLIITTNAGPESLGESMSVDRAAPILRRIKEFVSEAIEW